MGGGGGTYLVVNMFRKSELIHSLLQVLSLNFVLKLYGRARGKTNCKTSKEAVQTFKLVQGKHAVLVLSLVTHR